MPISDREHADLVSRVNRLDARIDRLGDRLDATEARVDHFAGMATMLRVIFGASVIGAITGLGVLIELLRHAGEP